MLCYSYIACLVITEMECVYCAVRTVALNGIIHTTLKHAAMYSENGICHVYCISDILQPNLVILKMSEKKYKWEPLNFTITVT
jgi:3-methyladenine DNA glycosylase Mpg